MFKKLSVILRPERSSAEESQYYEILRARVSLGAQDDG